MPPRADGHGRRERWDAIIGTVTASIAVLAALLIGGAHPATQLALSIALLLLAVGHGVSRGRRGIRIVPFAALFATFVALDVAQLLPLPAPLVRLLSPAAYEIRSAVTARGWMPLTLDCSATVMALVRALACLGVVVVAAGVARSRRVAARMIVVLALFGAVEAIIAIVQRAVNATAILGVYVPHAMPGMGIFGTLVSSNHTASVLSIGALTAAGLALDARGGWRILFIGCALVAALVAVATGSRGGVVGLGAGGFLLAAVALVRSRGPLQGLTMATAFLALVAAGALWSSEGLRQRLSPSSPAQLVDNQKTKGWVDGLHMAADYRWTGVGRGAFEAPLRAYRTADEGVRLVYPENFLVQSAAEWGFVATLALLLLAALSLRDTLRRFESFDLAVVGALAAVVAVVVHELMDFGTELPGVALPACVALGVVAGAAVRRDPDSRRLRPSAWAAVAAGWLAALLGGGWAAAHTLDSDDIATHDAVVAHRATAGGLAAAIARHPADDYLELLAADEAMQRHDASAMRHINRALLLAPASWRGHQLAAHMLAATGHRAQAAIEYGLAVRYGLLVDDRTLVAVLGDDILETERQEPRPLVALGGRLLAIGHVAEAKKAWARALELSEAREPTWAAEVRAASTAHDPALVAPLAAGLLRDATTADSFLVAAQGLADGGLPAKASEAIDRGLRAHPHDAALILGGARIKLASGQPDAAKQLLGANDQRDFTLEQRRDAQQLLAAIAERTGDVEAGVIARARAQLLERQIRAITFGNSRSDMK